MIVCQVKTGYWSRGAKVLDAELRGKLVVPFSELFEDTMNSVDTEAIGAVWDAIDVRH